MQHPTLRSPAAGGRRVSSTGACMGQRSALPTRGSAAPAAKQRAGGAGGRSLAVVPQAIGKFPPSHFGCGWKYGARAPRAPLSAGTRAAALAVRSAGVNNTSEVEAKKSALLSVILPTARGLEADSDTRGNVEEAQVQLEALGGDISPEKLAGLWELRWTTAPDVVGLLEADRQTGGLIKLGSIFQRFTADGRVDNIVKFSVPFFVEESEGLTLEVAADYTVSSDRRISLIFNRASLGRPQISKLLEFLLAPPLLPRNSTVLSNLLWIRDLELTVPLQGSTPLQSGSTPGQRVGAGYLISFLDEDMLVGRATGSGGSFIFRKVPGVEGDEDTW